MISVRVQDGGEPAITERSRAMIGTSMQGGSRGLLRVALIGLLCVGCGKDSKPTSVDVTTPGGAMMEMVWIEPGTFTMGSPPSEPGRSDGEGPQHEVTITKGFWLGKYELTQAQWESVMSTRPWGGWSLQENANNPAVGISWNDVQALIARLNEAEGTDVYRLPTEAEWEYACRAGTTTRWSFGDDESQLKDYAWYYDNAWNVGEQYVHEVGTKLPNPWGLYDMHGNVYEWVQDWYGSYPSSAQTDPTGPATGSSHVLRGGGFDHDARGVRSAFRFYYSPGGRGGIVGARLLKQGQELLPFALLPFYPLWVLLLGG